MGERQRRGEPARDSVRQLAAFDSRVDDRADEGEQLGVRIVGIGVGERLHERSRHSEVTGARMSPGIDDGVGDLSECSSDVRSTERIESTFGIVGKAAIELPQQTGLGAVDAKERGPADPRSLADLLDAHLVEAGRRQQFVGRVVEALGVVVPTHRSAIGGCRASCVCVR